MLRRNAGFTLVEILIVVIILGILAAIVIPQFTQASNDARESALQSDLQTVRSQVELYKIQHKDALPSAGATTGADLIAQLTSRTDADGNIMPDTGTAADYPFGPYLQQFPTNPFCTGAGNDPDGVVLGTADPAPGDGTTGWYFNTSTGKFSANTSGHVGW